MSGSQRTFAIAVLLVGTQILVVHSQWELLVRVVLPASIFLALTVLWIWRRYLGVWCISVGLAANLVVVVCNGGLIPMEHSTLVSAVGQERADQYQVNSWLTGSKDVLVADGQGKFLFLGDQIIITPFGMVGFVASPGDIVVLSGFVLFLLEISYYLVRKHRVRV